MDRSSVRYSFDHVDDEPLKKEPERFPCSWCGSRLFPQGENQSQQELNVFHDPWGYSLGILGGGHGRVRVVATVALA